jgi:hypothetical protein
MMGLVGYAAYLPRYRLNRLTDTQQKRPGSASSAGSFRFAAHLGFPVRAIPSTPVCVSTRVVANSLTWTNSNE